MLSTVLPADRELFGRSRLRAVLPARLAAERVEVPLLLAMGTAAALLTAYADLSLRIPGHKILLSILPMSFGLALAPRRRAGDLMALSAVATSIGLNFGGAVAVTWGAIVTMGLFGVLLDLAARFAPQGKLLYAAFAAAGLATNLVAFGLRVIAKHVAPGSGRRPFAEWISVAPLSFAICGVLAGLIGAGLFFEFSGPARRRGQAEPTR